MARPVSKVKPAQPRPPVHTRDQLCTISPFPLTPKFSDASGQLQLIQFLHAEHIPFHNTLQSSCT